MTFQPGPGIVLNRTAVQPIPDLGGPVIRDVLTQAEYESFRDVLPTWRDRLIAMILRNTGLRINEVLSLMVKECALPGEFWGCRVVGKRAQVNLLKSSPVPWSLTTRLMI